MCILALASEQNGHGAADFVSAVLENPIFANCAVDTIRYCLQYLIMIMTLIVLWSAVAT